MSGTYLEISILKMCCGAGEVNTSSGKKLHFQLTGLSGVYLIYMSAHTEEGEGRASLLMWVTVGKKQQSYG